MTPDDYIDLDAWLAKQIAELRASAKYQRSRNMIGRASDHDRDANTLETVRERIRGYHEGGE